MVRIGIVNIIEASRVGPRDDVRQDEQGSPYATGEKRWQARLATGLACHWLSAPLSAML